MASVGATSYSVNGVRQLGRPHSGSLAIAPQLGVLPAQYETARSARLSAAEGGGVSASPAVGARALASHQHPHLAQQSVQSQLQMLASQQQQLQQQQLQQQQLQQQQVLGTAGEELSATPMVDGEEDGPQEAADERNRQWTYNAERVIGSGTFGIVYSAHVMEADETVAIKKVFVDRRYRNKELQVWERMRHPNIVTLKHAFYTSGDSHDELYLNMVMEYVPETVYCVMKRFGKQRLQMPRILVLLYSYQACRALAHLRASGVVHRDIKPQNLLVDATKGHVLKLCDFGSAAKLGQGRPVLVAYICSRYYRAPELIFGATQYNTTVDLWSLGCVLAEMIRGRPLFPGENGVGQLVEIVKVLGSPTRRQLLAMNPQYFNFSFPSIKPCSWRTVFRKDVGSDITDLLAAFLEYDPEARIQPLQACAHSCFNELRQEYARVEGMPLPRDLFNLTRRETESCPPGLREKLIPVWHVSREPGAAQSRTAQSH